MADTPLCGAKNRSGGHCTQQAGWGTTHPGVGRCKFHGGASPNGELQGSMILARREAVAMGRPLPIAPTDAILQCIQIAAGEVAYCSERIADLDESEVVVQSVTITDRPLKEEKGAESSHYRVEERKTESSAQLHIWIRTRREAMDRLVQYGAIAIKANIEERRVRLAESQGQLLAQVIRGILADLGVAEHPQAPAVVRRHLMLVAHDAEQAA